jgi:hypothetical protein
MQSGFYHNPWFAAAGGTGLSVALLALVTTRNVPKIIFLILHLCVDTLNSGTVTKCSCYDQANLERKILPTTHSPA